MERLLSLAGPVGGTGISTLVASGSVLLAGRIGLIASGRSVGALGGTLSGTVARRVALGSTLIALGGSLIVGSRRGRSGRALIHI